MSDNMKTYKTIDEAFLNCLGDVFFKKDNDFTCVSKNDLKSQENLLKKGFIMLSYDETLRIAKEQQKQQKETHEKRAAEFAKELEKPHLSHTEKTTLERLKTQREHLAQQTAKKRFNYFPDYIQEFSDADPGL